MTNSAYPHQTLHSATASDLPLYTLQRSVFLTLDINGIISCSLTLKALYKSVADDSHEMSSLIFSEKRKLKCRLLQLCLALKGLKEDNNFTGLITSMLNVFIVFFFCFFLFFFLSHDSLTFKALVTDNSSRRHPKMCFLLFFRENSLIFLERKDISCAE